VTGSGPLRSRLQELIGERGAAHFAADFGIAVHCGYQLSGDLDGAHLANANSEQCPHRIGFRRWRAAGRWPSCQLSTQGVAASIGPM
jgi:hypothetical protein